MAIWNLNNNQTFHIVTLKSIHLFSILNILPTHDSGHLKNTGSLGYTDLPNVDTCTTQYKKITFLSIQDFKNSNFCLKTQILL